MTDIVLSACYWNLTLHGGMMGVHGTVSSLLIFVVMLYPLTLLL